MNTYSTISPVQSISFFSNFFEDACAYLRLLSSAKLLGIKVIKVRRNNLITYPEPNQKPNLANSGTRDNVNFVLCGRTD